MKKSEDTRQNDKDSRFESNGSDRGKRDDDDGDQDGDDDDEDDDNDDVASRISGSESDEEMAEKVKFNLKKLVRLLHVAKPVDLVMGLIGKR